MSNLINIGIPASLEQIVLRIGTLLFAKIIISLGTITYAAHQIAINILTLSYQPGRAFGIAATTLVGKSLGENNPDKAELYVKSTSKIGTILAAFSATNIFFFGPKIVKLYSMNPTIIINSSKALKLIAISEPFHASQFILAGALRGAGDTIWPMISTFFGIYLIRIPLSYFLVHNFDCGLIGAWIGFLFDPIIRWAFLFIRLRKGDWKNIMLK